MLVLTRIPPLFTPLRFCPILRSYYYPESFCQGVTGFDSTGSFTIVPFSTITSYL